MYDALSLYYDKLIDKSYYEKWIEYVDKATLGFKSGLDVGCGSGIFTVELTKRGRDIIGVDTSATMLDKAFERALGAGVKPRLINDKAENVKLTKPIDFVIAVNDVVNYMKDPSKFFANARQNLRKGGLLFFDMSSKYKFEQVLSDHAFVLEADKTVCVWENEKAGKNSLKINLRFFTETDGGLYEKQEETQTQYFFSADEITQMLGKCGFGKIKVYGDLTKSGPKEKSLRIHFKAERL